MLTDWIDVVYVPEMIPVPAMLAPTHAALGVGETLVMTFVFAVTVPLTTAITGFGDAPEAPTQV